MGDRAQIKINTFGYEGNPVYLYTHWGAENLEETLVAALSRHARWGDEEYLARIIFETMIRDNIGAETGFGIGTNKHADIWKLIELFDEEKITISVDHGDGMREVWNGSFEQFVQYFKGCKELLWQDAYDHASPKTETTV